MDAARTTFALMTVMAVCTILWVTQAQGQTNGVMINYGAGTREPSAVLDVRSDNQGFLAPKVIIEDLHTPAPVSAPAEGLIVYNTHEPTGKGYYFWTGVEWIALATTNNTISGSGTGHFLPKWNTDGISLTNSLLYQNGHALGLDTQSPDAPLHIYSATPQGASAASGIALNEEVATLILEQRHATNKTLQGVPNAGFAAAMLDFRANNAVGNRWSVGQVLGLVDAGPDTYAGGLAFTTAPGGTFTPNDSRTQGANLPIHMLIQGDGDVGIGTVTPTQKLDVDGRIRMRQGASPGFVATSSADGTINWTDPATLSIADNDWAKVGGGTPTLNDPIYHLGNVGIGLANPSSAWHVATTQTGNVAKLHNPTLGNGSLIGHEFGKANSHYNMAEFRYNHISDGNSDNFINLGLWGNPNSLVVQGSGNVGIGTASPNRKLVVQNQASQPEEILALYRPAAGNGSGNRRPISMEFRGDAFSQSGGMYNWRSSSTNAALAKIQVNPQSYAEMGSGHMGNHADLHFYVQSAGHGNMNKPIMSLRGNGDVRVAEQVPIQFRRFTFHCSDNHYFNTGYSADQFNAGIVGMEYEDAYYESGTRLFMYIHNGQWHLRAEIINDGDCWRKVDVMFVRKEISSRAGY